MTMDYSIRLGTTLRFSKEQELDLIKNVQDLTDRHKLGAYINELLRYVWENPEKFEGTVVDPYKNNISMKRRQFFNHVDSEVKKCKESLEYMYKEMLILNTAAKVGSTVGLVESTSEFLDGLEYIEGYIRKLKDSYNLDRLDGKCVSDSKDSVEEIANRAADILIKMMVVKRQNVSNVNFNQGVQITENNGSLQVDKDVTTVEDIKVESGVNNNIGTEKEVVEPENKEDNIDIDLISDFCGI